MLFQPDLHLGRLVGGVVIENQMHVTLGGHGLVDLAQEFQELFCAMAGHAIADDLARFHIEGSEKRGRAMALVIMGHGRRAALLQW